MTNNPNKVRQLEQLGVKVSDRIPHVIPATEWNRFYLETKATRSGHAIEFDGKPHLPEQDDPVIVES
jgi:GTP cyclohydrolase II